MAPALHHVLARPLEDPPDLRGIHVPEGCRQQYPQLAKVLASRTREKVNVGDHILIEVESSDVARTYSRVFEILFKDGQTCIIDDEQEPIVKEVVEHFWSNPATGDKRIRLLDLTGEGFAFLASDVLTFGWRDVSSPEFSLLYPVNVRMFWLFNGVRMQLYYLVHEDHILGVLR